MIIIYDKANTLTLPYANDKGKIEYQRFVPGKNEVSSEVWEAINNSNASRMEHYCRYLKPLNEQAAGDDGIKYNELSVAKIQELIENTMDIPDLEEIIDKENHRDKPRKSVIKSVNERIEYISKIEAKLEESRQ